MSLLDAELLALEEREAEQIREVEGLLERLPLVDPWSHDRELSRRLLHAAIRLEDTTRELDAVRDAIALAAHRRANVPTT